MEKLAKTPNPPYVAVIFTSTMALSNQSGYADMAEQMIDLASQQPGFLGVESTRGSDGLGVTVSYWRDPESVRHFHELASHREAQALGRSKWYECFKVRICRVEREYGFERN